METNQTPPYIPTAPAAPVASVIPFPQPPVPPAAPETVTFDSATSQLVLKLGIAEAQKMELEATLLSQQIQSLQQHYQKLTTLYVARKARFESEIVALPESVAAGLTPAAFEKHNYELLSDETTGALVLQRGTPNEK